jgi:hypothetical protein
LGRLCLICYEETKKNCPFCYLHYSEFKQEIDTAIEGKEKWLQFLATETARERRKINRERVLLEYDREDYKPY